MLATTSRSVTKAFRFTKSRTSAQTSRKYSAQAAPIVPSLKLATYGPAETKKMQAWLDKVNADPAKQKALTHIVDLARKKHAFLSKFWQTYSPVHGVKVPESGIKREVLAGVITSTSESWSEYVYALRSYQAKLQQDAAFYSLHADLASTDAIVAKKARSAIVSFIKSIQTKSELAKKGVLHLVRTGHIEGIRNGEAAAAANEYITRFKREVNVEVKTAHKLSPSEVEHYNARFHQIAGDERTKVIMTTKEDASILGGVVVTINGTVYDQSWKRQQENAMDALSKFNNL